MLCIFTILIALVACIKHRYSQCLNSLCLLQLPRRAAPADFDDDYREWDEENEPQNAGDGDEMQVQRLPALHVLQELFGNASLICSRPRELSFKSY